MKEIEKLQAGDTYKARVSRHVNFGLSVRWKVATVRIVRRTPTTVVYTVDGGEECIARKKKYHTAESYMPELVTDEEAVTIAAEWKRMLLLECTKNQLLALAEKIPNDISMEKLKEIVAHAAAIQELKQGAAT